MLSMSVGTFATTVKDVNYAKEIIEITDYFINDAINLSSWEENAIFTATNYIESVVPMPMTFVDETLSLSFYVLNSVVLGLPFDEGTKSLEALELLKKKQLPDGSFENLYESDLNFSTVVYAIIALESAQAEYDTQKALDYLLTYQNQDGGFGLMSESESDLDNTALALICISSFSLETSVKDSINNAKTYYKSALFETDGTIKTDLYIGTLSTVIQSLTDIGEDAESKDWGFLVSLLLDYKRENGHYDSYTYEFLETTTQSVMALEALYAVHNNGSMYKKLMTRHSLKPFNIADFMMIIIIFGVLMVLSIIFWIVVLVKKPKERSIEIEEELQQD